MHDLKTLEKNLRQAQRRKKYVEGRVRSKVAAFEHSKKVLAQKELEYENSISESEGAKEDRDRAAKTLRDVNFTIEQIKQDIELTKQELNEPDEA